MSNNRWFEFIKRSRKRYGIVKAVSCPAFNNEGVYFTDKGFKHLMYKKGIPRNKNEQAKRMRLIPKARIILGESAGYSEYREIKQTDSIVRFWAFERIVNMKTIKVVVRQINAEPKHFFSVMSGRQHKSKKNP